MGLGVWVRPAFRAAPAAPGAWVVKAAPAVRERTVGRWRLAPSGTSPSEAALAPMAALEGQAALAALVELAGPEALVELADLEAPEEPADLEGKAVFSR